MNKAITRVIFDGTAYPNQVIESERFNDIDYIFLDILNPVLDESEGIEIGLALLGIMDVIGKTITKYVPFKISEYTIGLTGDSKEYIAIPREFSETIKNMFVAINCSINITLRIYAVGREFPLDDTNSTVHEILDKVNYLQTSQNIANTSILALQGIQTTGLALIGTELLAIGAGITVIGAETSLLLAEVNALPLLLLGGV